MRKLVSWELNRAGKLVGKVQPRRYQAAEFIGQTGVIGPTPSPTSGPPVAGIVVMLAIS